MNKVEGKKEKQEWGKVEGLLGAVTHAALPVGV